MTPDWVPTTTTSLESALGVAVDLCEDRATSVYWSSHAGSIQRMNRSRQLNL